MNGSDIMIPCGSIFPYAGTTIPDGYLLCDGSAVSRTTYSDLFAVIGTMFGAGDSDTTFNLPNTGAVNKAIVRTGVVRDNPANYDYDTQAILVTNGSIPAITDRTELVMVDTTGGTLTITLPRTPNIGRSINIVDQAMNFGVNSLVIDATPNKIMGESCCLECDGSVRLIYTGTYEGWVIINDLNVRGNDNVAIGYNANVAIGYDAMANIVDSSLSSSLSSSSLSSEFLQTSKSFRKIEEIYWEMRNMNEEDIKIMMPRLQAELNKVLQEEMKSSTPKDVVELGDRDLELDNGQS